MFLQKDFFKLTSSCRHFLSGFSAQICLASFHCITVFVDFVVATNERCIFVRPEKGRIRENKLATIINIYNNIFRAVTRLHWITLGKHQLRVDMDFLPNPIFYFI